MSNRQRYESAVAAIDAATTITRLGQLSTAINERAIAGKFTPDEAGVLHGLAIRRAFNLGGDAQHKPRQPRITKTRRVDATTRANTNDFPF